MLLIVQWTRMMSGLLLPMKCISFIIRPQSTRLRGKKKNADHVGVYVMVSYLLVMKGSVWHIFLSVCPLFSLRSHCISQILESVNHIHQHDIVHRDLKVSGCPLPWQPCTYTHTYTHTPLLVAMATHRWLSVSSFPLHFLLLSLFIFFPLRRSLPSTAFTLGYSSYLFSDLSACLSVTRTLCVCEQPDACVFMSSGEMVSHDHMAGLVSHLWQGKDKDSNSTYAREHARTHIVCTVMKQVYYERGGEGIDKPQELPGQPMWHHTTHGAAGEGLEMSQIADRLKCKRVEEESCCATFSFLLNPV